jgi:pyruvate formate lyase activating enzyme
LKALLEGCKGLQIHTIVDTSGLSSWENYREIIPFTDLFLYDLKLMDENQHKASTGVSNQLILENLTRLVQNGKQVIIRIPVIPGINDYPENITKTSSYLASLGSIQKVDLLPYHHIASDKYQRMGSEYPLADIQPAGKADLENIANQLRGDGFTVTIGG